MGVRALIASAALLTTIVAASVASAAHTDVSAAAAAVAAYSRVPTFVAPGPALSVTSARGKKVLVIPGGRSPDVSSMSTLTAGIREAGAAAGVKVTTCANDGRVTAQTICLNKAVAGKFDLVVLAGYVDAARLSVPLAAVKAASIPVIASHVPAPSDFGAGVDPGSAAATDFNVQRTVLDYQKALSGLTATVPAPFGLAAKLMADFVTAAANGAATTIVIAEASDVPESTSMLSIMQKEFASVCGSSCSVSSVNIPYSTWETGALAAVKGLTLAKTTQYLLPVFDGISSIASQAMADANRSRAGVIRPNICSFGGAPFAIQMGQAGNRVVCDIAENMRWTGWATMDQALRVLTGARPVASENLPVLIWSANTWFAPDGPGFPPALDAGWGSPAATYVGGYRKLWGLET